MKPGTLQTTGGKSGLRSAGIPRGHWKTTTFVGALTTRCFIAPRVLDGPINRDAFEVYVDRVLIPELRPGDTVIMDNLSSHKGPAVREMIEAAGAELRYLPPSSPDFNPIEMAFSKLKALLRKAAERTIAGLWGPSATFSISSSPKNAATTSTQPDTIQHDRRTL